MYCNENGRNMKNEMNMKITTLFSHENAKMRYFHGHLSSILLNPDTHSDTYHCIFKQFGQSGHQTKDCISCALE